MLSTRISFPLPPFSTALKRSIDERQEGKYTGDYCPLCLCLCRHRQPVAKIEKIAVLVAYFWTWNCLKSLKEF